jgi:hypothetical protein
VNAPRACRRGWDIWDIETGHLGHLGHSPGVSAGRLWRAVNGHLRLKSIEAPHDMARCRRRRVSTSQVGEVGRCGREGESIHPRRPDSEE